MGVGGQRHFRPLYFRDRDRVPVVRENVWVLGPFWMGAARTFQPVASLYTDYAIPTHCCF